MAPLLPSPLLTRAMVAPLLKEKCTLSFLFSLNLSLSLSLFLPSLSLTLSCLSLHGKTLLCGFFCTCVSDQKREDEGGGEGWCPGLVFGFRLPTVFSTPPPFLHSSLLLLLLSQGRQLNKEVWVCHLFFFLSLSLIKSVALGQFFLFVSV